MTKTGLNVGLVKTFETFYHSFLNNIYIRFGTKLHRQIVGIPMATNCTPFITDLFLFSYERDFMTYLSDETQAETIDAFNSNSRYFDDLLNTRSTGGFLLLQHSSGVVWQHSDLQNVSTRCFCWVLIFALL